MQPKKIKKSIAERRQALRHSMKRVRRLNHRYGTGEDCSECIKKFVVMNGVNKEFCEKCNIEEAKEVLDEEEVVCEYG